MAKHLLRSRNLWNQHPKKIVKFWFWQSKLLVSLYKFTWFCLCWRMCCAPHRCYKHQAHCCITTAAPANLLHMSFLLTEFEHFTIGNNGQRSVPARLEVVHEDRLWCFLSQFWCCKLYCIHQLIRSQDVDDSEMLGFAGPWRWTNIVRPVHFLSFSINQHKLFLKNGINSKQMSWAPNRIQDDTICKSWNGNSDVLQFLELPRLNQRKQQTDSNTNG